MSDARENDLDDVTLPLIALERLSTLERRLSAPRCFVG
jgi:hypothetical protein